MNNTYYKILNEIASVFDMDQWNDQVNIFQKNLYFNTSYVPTFIKTLKEYIHNDSGIYDIFTEIIFDQARIIGKKLLSEYALSSSTANHQTVYDLFTSSIPTDPEAIKAVNYMADIRIYGKDFFTDNPITLLSSFIDEADYKLHEKLEYYIKEVIAKLLPFPLPDNVSTSNFFNIRFRLHSSFYQYIDIFLNYKIKPSDWKIDFIYFICNNLQYDSISKISINKSSGNLKAWALAISTKPKNDLDIDFFEFDIELFRESLKKYIIKNNLPKNISLIIE